MTHLAREFAPSDVALHKVCKENLGRDSPAKRYNDSATGARPNQAPTLMRTMANGSKRPEKFDGVEGDFVIDRKFSVVDRPHARAQLQRSPTYWRNIASSEPGRFRPDPRAEGQSHQAAQQDECHQHQGQSGRTIIAVQIARLIANVVLFFDLCDEDILDPDTAVQQMEELAADLQALDKGFLRELVDAFAVIAPEYSGESQDLVRSVAHGFYLEEPIAAGDPVRLAELEVLRDAGD